MSFLRRLVTVTGEKLMKTKNIFPYLKEGKES